MSKLLNLNPVLRFAMRFAMRFAIVRVGKLIMVVLRVLSLPSGYYSKNIYITLFILSSVLFAYFIRLLGLVNIASVLRELINQNSTSLSFLGIGDTNVLVVSLISLLYILLIMNSI
jgi:hypothetical protein